LEEEKIDTIDRKTRNICSYCGKTFYDEKYLEKHINEAHLKQCYNNIKKKNKSNTHKGYAFVKCLNCGKKLPEFIHYEDIKEMGYNPYDIEVGAYGYPKLPPEILFCCVSCIEEYYNKQYKSWFKFGGYDSAPLSDEYGDQFDWNR